MQGIISLIGSLTGIIVGILVPIGGIVGLGWFLINGEWAAIGVIIAGFIISPMALGLAMMPSLLVVAPLVSGEPGRLRLGLAAIVSEIYRCGILTAWFYLCIQIAFRLYVKGDIESITPYILSALSMSVGAVAYIGSKDGPDSLSGFSTATFAVMAIALVVTGFSTGLQFVSYLYGFAFLTGIGILVALPTVASTEP